MPLMDARERAHDAFVRRAWQEAFDAFGEVPDLTADDLDTRAECAHWLGLAQDTIASYAQAYDHHLADGSPRKAALSAFMLAIYTRLQGEHAQADAWLARSERQLAEDPEESAEHGYPLYLRIAALMGSDLDAAADSARRMQDVGRRFADDTLVALGVFFEGRALIKQAQVQDGLRLLDEAMLAALSDRLKPFWTGAIYCGLLDACHELADVRRGREWTEATARWCDPLPLASLYPGICRVHRAEILGSHGAWDEAEAEALAACEDMAGIDVFVVADAWYEVGEVRRRRGDLAGADEAYARAHEVGKDPQPGLALLRLAQGRVEQAVASIGTALATFGGSRLERAPLLAAQVEIALGAGDLDLAEAAAKDLVDIGDTFESTSLQAAGHCRSGAVALARNETVTALAALRLAQSIYHELDAPYDTARCRVLMSEAYRRLGDDDAADRERATAKAAFERLGAAADLRLLDTGSSLVSVPGGLTAREVEVLRLVAQGHTNRQAAEELYISEKTVARHLANIFTKLDVSTRAAAVAWAFAHDLVGTGT
jgi:DNA-binding NarL/FixJ family response regulator